MFAPMNCQNKVKDCQKLPIFLMLTTLNAWHKLDFSGKVFFICLDTKLLTYDRFYIYD
jgi:hypothetical protein